MKPSKLQHHLHQAINLTTNLTTNLLPSFWTQSTLKAQYHWPSLFRIDESVINHMQAKRTVSTIQAYKRQTLPLLSLDGASVLGGAIVRRFCKRKRKVKYHNTIFHWNINPFLSISPSTLTFAWNYNSSLNVVQVPIAQWSLYSMLV